MYEVSFSNQYFKDYKLCVKRGLNIGLLDDILLYLAENGSAPIKCKPHILSGNLHGLWECHVKPDWLLMELTPICLSKKCEVPFLTSFNN